MSAPPVLNLGYNNHKSRLRAHSKMSAANKDKGYTIFKHFHSDEHHVLPDIEVHVIDKVNAKDNLLAKEGQWLDISTSLSETRGS